MIKNTRQYLERADYTWSEDSIRLINTPALSARQTFFYVQETGYFRTFPPYFTERANLNSFLIIFTLSGIGHLEYQGQTYQLPSGSLAYINCMHHHFYKCPFHQEWEFLWLHFNGSSALGYYNEFCRNGFRILHDLEPSSIEAVMRKILLLTQKKELYSEIEISGNIVALLTQILTSGSKGHSMSGYLPPYLQQILKKIENEFQSDISLDGLSAEVSISKFHLSREFKRYTGITVHEYLTLTRLNHAKELLKYSNMTVEQIAYSCGFHHVSHFIQLFKSHEALTPLQFRKEWGIPFMKFNNSSSK